MQVLDKYLLIPRIDQVLKANLIYRRKSDGQTKTLVTKLSPYSLTEPLLCLTKVLYTLTLLRSLVALQSPIMLITR